MNMTDRELMQQALEVLERCPALYRAPEAATALRERLAQPEQEPVAYASDVEFDDETEIIPAEQKGKLGTAGLRIPLYIKPPASKPWVGLTQQDIDIAFDDTQEGGGFDDFARAIEAKLKEKNNGTR